MQPSLYSTLFFYKHTTQEREKKNPWEIPARSPPHSLSPGCQPVRQTVPISALQLTPVAHNHRVSWLAAASLQHRFLCSDIWGLVSISRGNNYTIIAFIHQTWYLFWSQLHNGSERSEVYVKYRSRNIGTVLEQHRKPGSRYTDDKPTDKPTFHRLSATMNRTKGI